MTRKRTRSASEAGLGHKQLRRNEGKVSARMKKKSTQEMEVEDMELRRDYQLNDNEQLTVEAWHMHYKATG